MRKPVIAFLCFAFTAALGASFAPAQEVPPPPEMPVPSEVRKDVNFDGEVDRVEKFDGQGNIAEVTADTTGDGKMDNWVHFKDGKVQKAERDTNADGRPDTYVTYEAKTGHIKMIEADSSGDGKINEWLYYKDGKPEKAEKDTNTDGKPDIWVNY